LSIKEFKEGINTQEAKENKHPSAIDGQHDTRAGQEASQKEEKEVTHLTGPESPTRR